MESNTGTATPNPLVKAAALAWYRRAAAGTLTTPPSPRRPSAHPLIPSATTAAASPRKTPPPSPEVVTLLDKYEIEWITAQLQRLITSSSSSSPSSSSGTYSGKELGDRSRVGKERSRRRLFGSSRHGRRHAAMLCGSVRDAVVETASKSRAAKPRDDLAFQI